MGKLSTYLFFMLFVASLWSQEEVRPLGELPDVVSETSGLIFYNDKLVTHNDSGNTPQLFEIDTVSLALTRTVTIDNAQNIDWEDMAQDDSYIYIGDFGNNLGTRDDLVIYRIAKQEYEVADIVSAERIFFSYQDQTEFNDSGNSDWDAEALFVLDQQLIILTKQWRSNGTVAYAIPKVPGTYEARRLDAFDVQGLVTGATYHPESEVLYLVGYTSVLDAFLFKAEGITETRIFGGTIQRLPVTIGFSQVEAIGYVDANTYFLSSEFFSNQNPAITLPATLYRLGIPDSMNVDPEPIPTPEPEPVVPELIVHQSLEDDMLFYELPTDKPPIIARAIFDFSGRMMWYETGNELENSQIDLSGLPNAIYFLTLYFRDSKLTKAFAVY